MKGIPEEYLTGHKPTKKEEPIKEPEVTEVTEEKDTPDTPEPVKPPEDLLFVLSLSNSSRLRRHTPSLYLAFIVPSYFCSRLSAGISRARPADTRKLPSFAVIMAGHEYVSPSRVGIGSFNVNLTSGASDHIL